MKKIQQVSIKGLLYKEDKILFLRTTEAKKWELPGGRMDFGENVEQTFKREIKEELGFENVKIGNLLNTWSFTSVREKINYHFIVFDFEIYTKESKIRLSDEHIEYKWVGIDDFEKMDMRDGHKETLRKYFRR
ncbi:MAG: NUDIX hydrolase [Candidatus Pacebacteria bacterium]|nr:NUDIX hydrolase [Candidatus Paceibacterota bacterium]